MKYIKSFLLVTLLSILSVSCLFNPPIEKIDSGKVSIRLGDVRSVEGEASSNNNTESEDDITFTLDLANIVTGFHYTGTFNNDMPIELDNIKSGNYHVIVFGTNDYYEYTANQDITLDFRGISPNEALGVFITVEKKLVNGQFTLDFTGIDFDDSSYLTLNIKDNETKEEVTSIDLSSLSIINNIYTVPLFIKEGSYLVSLTGGKIGEEVYIVNEDKPITITKGEKVSYKVSSKAYKTYYVKSNSGVSEENGTVNYPFKDISKALNEAKGQDSVIVIDGSYILNAPLTLDNTYNICFKGINNGLLSCVDNSCIINNGAVITLNNITVTSSNKDDIKLNDGTFNIKNDVKLSKIYVTEKALNLSPININGSLPSNVAITLDKFILGKKLFNSSLSSNIDFYSFTLSDAKYVIDGKGEISNKTCNVQIDFPTGYSELYYELKINGETVRVNFIKQSTPEAKHIYIYAKEGDNIDINLLTTNNLGKKEKWEEHLTVHSVNETITFTSGTLYTATLKLLDNPELIKADYPLTVTITDKEGKIIEKKVTSLPYEIYLDPKEYKINITCEDPLKVINKETSSSFITLSMGEIKENNISFSTKDIFYVSSSPTNGFGTKEKPFNSLDSAIKEGLKTPTPFVIVLLSDIDISNPIDVNGGNFIIMSDSDTVRTLTCNNGFVNLQNNSEVSIQNIKVIGNNLSSSGNSLVKIDSSILKLDRGSILSTLVGDKAVALISGSLQIEDNGLVENGNVEITDGTIEIMNHISLASPIKISTDAPITTNVKRVISSPFPFLIKEYISSFTPTQSECEIDDNGDLKKINKNENVNIYEDIDNFINDTVSTSITITRTIKSEDELLALMKKLRTIPLTKSVNLSLTLDPTITSLTSNVMNPYGDGIKTISSINLTSTTLTTIGTGAFKNYSNLTTFNFLPSITDIEDEAFLNCEKLNVSIPSSLRKVGKNALYRCGRITTQDPEKLSWLVGNLSNSTFDISQTTFDQNKINFAIYKDYPLSRIYKPSDLTKLLTDNSNSEVSVDITLEGETANLASSIPSSFTGLINLNILNTTKISKGVLSNCSGKLKNIKIPKSTTNIESGFLQGTSDVAVTIDDANPYFKVIDQCFIVNKSGTDLYQYFRSIGTNSNVVLPKTISVINPLAFVDTGITSLDMNKKFEHWSDSTKANTSDRYYANSTLTSDIQTTLKDKKLYYITLDSELQADLDSASTDNVPLIKLNIVSSTNSNVLIDDYMSSVSNYSTNIILNLELGNEIKVIKSGSFSNSAIKEIVLPPNLEFIEGTAFSNADITDIVFPSSFKAFGANNFIANSNHHIKTIFKSGGKWATIGGKVIVIQQDVDSYSQLKIIDVLPANKAYRWSDVFTTDGTLNVPIESIYNNNLVVAHNFNMTSMGQVITGINDRAKFKVPDIYVALLDVDSSDTPYFHMAGGTNFTLKNPFIKGIILPRNVSQIHFGFLKDSLCRISSLYFEDMTQKWFKVPPTQTASSGDSFQLQPDSSTQEIINFFKSSASNDYNIPGKL